MPSQSQFAISPKKIKNQKISSSQTHLTLDKSLLLNHASERLITQSKEKKQEISEAKSKLQTITAANSSRQKIQLPPILSTPQVISHSKNASQISQNLSTKAESKKGQNLASTGKISSNTSLQSDTFRFKNNNNNNSQTIFSAGNLDIFKDKKLQLSNLNSKKKL